MSTTCKNSYRSSAKKFCVIDFMQTSSGDFVSRRYPVTDISVGGSRTSQHYWNPVYNVNARQLAWFVHTPHTPYRNTPEFIAFRSACYRSCCWWYYYFVSHLLWSLTCQRAATGHRSSQIKLCLSSLLLQKCHGQTNCPLADCVM